MNFSPFNEVYNKKSGHLDLDLFVLSVDVVRHYVPAYVVCEMTPEHEYTDADYTELVTKMKREGYVAHVHPRLNSFECGDATSRPRFFAVFIHSTVPKANTFNLDLYKPGTGPSMMRSANPNPRRGQEPRWGASSRSGPNCRRSESSVTTAR